MFDGICSQSKELQTLDELQTLYGSTWTFSSSGRYMFLRFAVGTISSSRGFLAKIHYGNEILVVVQRGNKNYSLYLFL